MPKNISDNGGYGDMTPEQIEKYEADKEKYQMTPEKREEYRPLMSDGKKIKGISIDCIIDSKGYNNEYGDMTPEQRNEILERFRKSQITPEQKQKLKDDIASGRVTMLAVDRPAYADILSQKKGTEP